MLQVDAINEGDAIFGRQTRGEMYQRIATSDRISCACGIEELIGLSWCGGERMDEFSRVWRFIRKNTHLRTVSLIRLAETSLRSRPKGLLIWRRTLLTFIATRTLSLRIRSTLSSTLRIALSATRRGSVTWRPSRRGSTRSERKQIRILVVRILPRVPLSEGAPGGGNEGNKGESKDGKGGGGDGGGNPNGGGDNQRSGAKGAGKLKVCFF
jgi:hypothetical protein